MKTFSLILLLLFFFGCSSKQEIEGSPKYHKYVLHYIQKEYVEPAERKLANLQEEKSKSQSKNISKEKLAHIDNQIQLCKLWPIYYKVYILKDQNQGEATKLERMFFKIHTRYKELTGKKFPEIEKEFYQKYGDKMKTES